MSTSIRLKKSSVSSNAPTTGDIDYGELAINYADGKLYYKTSSNTIDYFGSVGAGGGSSLWTSNGSDIYYNTGNVGINDSTPSYKLDVNGDFRATGALRDSSGDAGTSGQILSSTGTGTNWIDASAGGSSPWTTSGSDIYYNTGNVGIGVTSPGEALEVDGNIEITGEFIGDLRGPITFKAQAGENLTLGDAVYISGVTGQTPIVSKADADDASKMPAFGLVEATTTSGNPCTVVTFGTFIGYDTVNTNNSPTWALGDTLYIDTTPGGLTNVPPAGESSLIQNIGKVQRVDSTDGRIKVGGAGRTNATPNLNEGRLFVGNASNRAVADGTIHVDIANTRVGINDTTPSYTLDVNGTFRTTGNSIIGDGVGDTLTINAGTIDVPSISAGTDNTVLVYNGTSIVTDEIDSRVWGSTLVDGSGTANKIAKWSDSNTVTDSTITDDGSTVSTSSDISLTTANSTISGATGLTLEETGDTYGTVRLKLQNRFGVNGAIFEQAGSVDLVDFVFKSLNNQANIRFEDRSGSKFMADPEFQIGEADDPTFIINAASTVTYGAYLRRGRMGIATATPAYDLDVNGTFRVTGNSILGDASGDSVTINAATIALANVAAGTDNTVLVYNGSSIVTDEIDSRVWGSTLVDGSGTTNYITKWSDSNTVTDSVITDDGTTVTIGGNLTVNGTTTTLNATNSVVTDNLFELNSGVTSNANDSGIIIERGSTGDNALFIWDESADKFALGTTTATADSTGNITYTDAGLRVSTLETSGNVTLGDGIGDSVTINAGTVSLNSALGSGSLNTVLIYNSGAVSIQTIDSRVWATSPLVDGSGTANKITKWSDSNTITDSLITDDGTTVTIGANDFVVDTNTLYVDASADSVGIGITSPQANLDVNGSNTSSIGLQLRSGDSNTGTDSTQIVFAYHGASYNSNGYAHSIRTRHNAFSDSDNAIDFWLWDQGTDTASTLGSKRVMTIEGTGRVGIGTNDPANTLDINGSLKINGEVVEKTVNTTGVTGTTALDPANGTVQRLVFSGDVTFTDSLADGESITLHIDDGAGNVVTAWPTITWATGSAPTLNTSTDTIVAVWKVNSTLYGATVGTSQDVVSDTTPQLGGDLDVNGKDIVSVSNGDIELAPDGTGVVVFKGDATKGSGQFKLNCEQNTHAITIKGPPHSAAASYTLVLPNDDGTSNQVLTTDGSGNLSWSTPSGSYGNSDVDTHLNTSSASSGQVLSWNGSDYAWVAQSSGGGGGGGTDSRIISIDAGALVARTTNGAASATEEYATNDVMSDHFLFDGATEEGVQFRFHMPSDWDGNAVNAKFYWDAATGASAADGVTWGIAMQAFQNDDALDNAFGTSVDTDDAVIAVGDLHVSPLSSDITIAGSPSAGDLIVAEVTRVVGDANDTMTEDAKLIGVTIHYNATTVNYDGQLGITIDGAGSAISTGSKGFLRVPYDCTITAAQLLADQSGSIVIDVLKDTYANFPPTDSPSDSICASALPTLSSSQKSEDTTLTGWTTSITKGDILSFIVDSASTVTRVTLTLAVTKG